MRISSAVYLILLFLISFFVQVQEAYAQDSTDSLPHVTQKTSRQNIDQNSSQEKHSASKKPLQMLLKEQQKPLNKGMNSWRNPHQPSDPQEPKLNPTASPEAPEPPSVPATRELNKPKNAPLSATEKALQEIMGKQADPKTSEAQPSPKKRKPVPERTWNLN